MRRVYLFGEVSSERSEKFIGQLHDLFEESAEPITIYINSCGGSVTEALAIYDVLQCAPCEIFTVGLGKVHSAAVTVLLSAPADNRSAFPNTEFMSHDISWKSDGPRAYLRDRVDQLERTVSQLVAVYTRDTKLSAEEAKHMFFTDLADHYFMPEDALRMGFISSITGPAARSAMGPAQADARSPEPMGVIQSEAGAPVNSSHSGD